MLKLTMNRKQSHAEQIRDEQAATTNQEPVR